MKKISGQKAAILVANGFSERDLVSTQAAMTRLGVQTRLIGMDHGLVNAWNGESWGLNFACDQVISTALAADFDILCVPGGRRSIDKLKLTAHTRRFVGGFLDAGKPVALFDEAAELVALTGRSESVFGDMPSVLRIASDGGNASAIPAQIADHIAALQDGAESPALSKAA